MWAGRDSWSIPKGEVEVSEDHLTAARREFHEEVGVPVPDGELIDLGSERQSGNKTNFVWAVQGDFDLINFHSNTFTMEWPPKSGEYQEIPENDKAAWFDLVVAKQKLFKSQTVFIDRLAAALGQGLAEPPTAEQQTLL